MNSLRAAQGYIQELKDWGQVASVRMIDMAVVDNCAYICSTLLCQASHVRDQQITCPTLVPGLLCKVHEFDVVQGQEVQTERVLLEFNLPPGQKSAINHNPGTYNVVLPVKIYCLSPPFSSRRSPSPSFLPGSLSCLTPLLVASISLLVASFT
jgi:hypothetical protein